MRVLGLYGQYRHHTGQVVSAKDFGEMLRDGLTVAEECFNLCVTVLALQLD